MKIKLLIAGIIAFGAVLNVQAQTEKGKFLIGGGSILNFYSENFKWDDSEDPDKSTGFNLYPQAGYFVADGLAAGVEFPFSHSWSDDRKFTDFNIGPFVKYYFGKSVLKPYLKAATRFGKTKRSTSYNANTYKYTGKQFAYELGAGAAIFVTPRVALDLGLHYSQIESKSKEEEDAGYDKVDVESLDLNVGVTFFF